MTNSEDRLDRIEAIVQSNARAIQAMLEQRETDRLRHEQRIELLEENQRQIRQTQQGIANLLASIDDDRPTILRRLNSIENKVDRLLES